MSRPTALTRSVGAPSAAADDEVSAWLYALGRRVRLLRLSRELTQEDLAEQSGMSRSFVSLIEHGSHGPNLVKLFGLARALGLEPWELLELSPVALGEGSTI